MIPDPIAQQIGIGGAVAVLMTVAVLKFLPSFMKAIKDNNGKGRSGDLTTIDLEGRMTEIARKANEESIADIRHLLESRDAGRNEKLREIIRQELNQFKDRR